jgi:hypothetical protein
MPTALEVADGLGLSAPYAVDEQQAARPWDLSESLCAKEVSP